MTSIRDRSLFVVQTDDTVNSIRYDEIKEDIGPLAKPNLVSLGIVGTPGIMWPGDSLIYNRLTGELNVEQSAIRRYIGLVGNEADQQKGMNGSEKPGDFYVVADFKYKFTTNDWGTGGSDLANQTRVYIGDMIEKVDVSNDWRRIPMQIGNNHVHNNFLNYPHISEVDGSDILSNDTLGGSVIAISGG